MALFSLFLKAKKRENCGNDRSECGHMVGSKRLWNCSARVGIGHGDGSKGRENSNGKGNSQGLFHGYLLSLAQ
jgi:hypothetical protein